MSLETVVEDIRDEARARAEEIRASGEAEAEQILAEAESDAEALREEREAAVERRVGQEREQALSSAKLEAKQQRLEARRDVLAEVREEVEDRLANLEGDHREELTRALLEDALWEEFEEDDEVTVYCRPDDEALLEEILSDRDGATVVAERDCLGGVIVESESSRVRVNNTFDSVLETVWDENLKGLSEKLFQQ